MKARDRGRPVDPSGVVACRYRRSVRGHGLSEDAVCGLLERISGVRDRDACRVGRDACEACRRSKPTSPGALNPVVASLLCRLCDAAVGQGGAPGMPVEKAVRLGILAEESLASSRVEPATLRSCDVLVCCDESTEPAERAVLGALSQRDAVTIVHLVDDGGGGRALVDRFARHWNVVVHRNPVRRGAFATLHDLLPRLRSEFVAIQDPATVSHPDRIARSVGLLVTHGAEIMAAPIETPSGVVRPREPGRAYRRYVPAATLVLRRASLIDMGGMAAGREDLDAELVFRAAREGRAFVLATEPTVAASGAPSRARLGPAPTFELREGSLRHHALGFPEERVESDVVLPFHGCVHFLRESLPRLLEQEGAEALVHLVDDGTPDGAEEVLRYWGSHPRVRTYRNVRNIGQFASFNAVARYFETRLVAVQDADDVSDPHRLRRSGNLIRLADAEIFGGGMRPFRDPPGAEEEGGPAGPRSGRSWRSSLPHPGVRFFLLNPTAMMRVATFEAMRGFGDYGDLECNKCGLDTEFYVRAYYAGARFAISREVVVNYRVHPGSAVHNERTGWGSRPRLWSQTENGRRFADFQRGPFDPRVFGALRSADGLTQRVVFR